jgi:hypothetical protein
MLRVPGFRNCKYRDQAHYLRDAHQEPSTEVWRMALLWYEVGLIFQGSADAGGDHAGFLVHRERDGALEPVRSCDEHLEAATNRVRSDPGLVGCGEGSAGGADGRFDSFAPA